MNTNTQTIETSRFYEIADRNMEEVALLIEKLNKRCVKLGLPQITLHDTGMWEDKEKHAIFHDVIITGSSPVVEGYQFVASIQHIATDGNVVAVMPLASELASKIGMEQFRTCDSRCDHCHTARARNATYVIHNVDTNVTLRVGRTCLKDFTGHKDIHAVADYCQELFELMERIAAYEEETEGGNGNSLVLVTFLKWVACSIRIEGWISKGKAYENDTQSTCANAQSMEREHALKLIDAPSEADSKLATLALAWIRDENNKIDVTQDYMWNLYTVCKNSFITYKHVGIAASLINAYQRATQKEIEQKTAKATSNFVGEESKRLTVEVTCVRINSVETQWGGTHIMSFIDDNGNKIVWYASTLPMRETGALDHMPHMVPVFEQGGRYKLTGTIKKHEDNEKYGKQTIMTRCKGVEVASVAA